MRQIFAGNPQAVRAIVVAGGDDGFPAVILVTCAGLGERIHDECIVFTVDFFDAFVEAGFDTVMLDSAAVIFQGFDAVSVFLR